jgi:site-specific DNA-cytosine methylase
MPHLLELFCGTKSIGKVFEAAGWRVTSVDLNAKCDPTICCDALELRPKQIEGEVDIVWASPPCTQFSKARTTAKTPRNLELADSLVQVGIQTALHFDAPLFMENPQSMLEHREIVADLHMELIDYCIYACEDWPKYYRKRTMIFCSGHDWKPARPLCKNDCRGCPDGKRHIEAAQRGGTRGSPGNRLEELYAIPPALPREILAWCEAHPTTREKYFEI